MNLEFFLRLILPSEGWLCWVQIKNKRPVQGHVRPGQFDVLASTLQQIDMGGGDAYFGCASFATDASRKGENAYGAKAFWFDIDCGEGKEYADIGTAIDALDGFCADLSLGQPLLVKSGYGIHAWWPLTQVVPKDQWIEHAKILQKLAEKHGLRVDPTRTADIASILRAPGTHNHKYGTVSEVEIWDADPDSYVPIDTAAFLGILTKHSIFVEPAFSDDRASLDRGYADGERTKALWEIGGRLYSKGLPQDSVLAELRKWNALNTPPLPDEKLVRDTGELAKRHAKQIEEVKKDLPDLPGAYQWDTHRQMILFDAGDENVGRNPSVSVITHFPVFLVDITRLEYKPGTAYVFRQWLPHEGWRDFSVLAENFESSSWFSYMAKNGADRSCIGNLKLFKDYVSFAATEIRKERAECMRYEQMGWKDDKSAFLLGDVLHTGAGREHAYLTDEILSQARLFNTSGRADLAVWRKNANLLFSDIFLPLGLGLVASFTPPILGLCLNITDGGLVLHYVSEDSGRGKSKVVEASASVWGQPQASILTASDTLNAIFKIISVNNNIPAHIDELQQIDPQVAQAIVKRFTTGQDKNRLSRDGSLAPKAKNYQTLLMTTANFSMVEKLQSARDEGAIARIMELTPNKAPKDEAIRMGEAVKTMLANSGVAGREFINVLLRPGSIEIIQRQFAELKSHYSNIGGAENRFICYLMAAIHIAACILVNAEILQFDLKRLISFMIETCGERKAIIVKKDHLELFSEFLADFAPETLIISGKYNPKQTNSVLIHNEIMPRKITVRFVKDEGRLYLPASTIADWCVKKGYFLKNIRESLIEKGILIDERKQVTLSAYTQLNTGRFWCWEVDMNHPSLSGVLTDTAKLPIVEHITKEDKQNG